MFPPITVFTAYTITLVVITLGADEVIPMVVGVIVLVGMQSRREKRRRS